MFENKTKTFLLFTLIFITAIGLTAVTAADVDDNTIIESTTADITDDVQTSTDSANTDVNSNDYTITKNANKNIKSEAGEYTITDSSYSTYFDSQGILNTTAIENGSSIILSGDISNKEFIFDNVTITVENDGTNTLYNSTITTQNDAKVTFNGLVINNTNTEDYVILLESSENILNNTVINVVNENPLHVIDVTGDSNTIMNTTVTVQAPSAAVLYDKNYVGHPVASAIYVSSSNNLIEDTQIYYNATETEEFYPSADGIDIQSEGYGLIAENNTIRNTTVAVNGTNYVYGINVGRTKNTTLDNVDVEVNSLYYTNAVQLFDADTTIITGNLTSIAGTESYAVYSTAMGTGKSKNITITANMNVESPQATGVLIEGSSDVLITDSNFNITGENATATRTFVDWMGNEPSNFKLLNSNITTQGENKNDVIYFGLCDDVEVDNNTIITSQRSNINVTNTTNAAITNNYIVNDGTGLGDYAVVTNSEDVLVENNTPTSKVVEDYEQIIEKLLNPDKVNTTMTINPVEATVGETVTFSAKLTDVNNEVVTSGKVVFKVNGQTLKDENNDPLYAYVNNGVASVKYTAAANWAKGNLTVEAVYSGDKSHLSCRANSTDALTVTKSGVEITLDETEITAKSGDTIKLVAKVTDTYNNSVNGGKLLYKLNGVTIATTTVEDGVSILTYTIPDNYSAKTYTLTVDYISNYYNRTSTNATVTLEKKQTSINPDEISIVDNKTSIKATITDENGKTLTRNTAVVIKVNGKTMTSTTSQNGIIDVSFDNTFKATTFTLLIISGENGIYNSSRMTMTLTKE